MAKLKSKQVTKVSSEGQAFEEMATSKDAVLNKRELPKNIRQIGEPDAKQRIYVEDYVVTYLNQLAHPTNANRRAAVLLGNWKECGGQPVLFIYGAVEVEGLEQEDKKIEFTNEIWEQARAQISCYFKGSEMVGWFLSCMGDTVKVTDLIKQAHARSWPKEGSILYLLDALEQDEQFYMNENGILQKQEGYYIYYERNAQMQTYLIENQAVARNSPVQRRIEYKDGQLLHSYHEMLAGKKRKMSEQKMNGILYAASAFVILIVLAFGINVMGNYDKLKKMQLSLDQIMSKAQVENRINDSETMVEDVSPGNKQEVQAEQSELGPGDDTAQIIANQDTTAESTVSADTQTAPTTTNSVEADIEKENQTVASETTTAPAIAAATTTNQNYYVVQNGDTLLSISKKMYQSDSYVSAIKKANELGESDIIYPGQQIIIPSVQ